MSSLYLVINTDSAAFTTNEGRELARILHAVADWAEDGALPTDGSTTNLFDINSNQVGWVRKEPA